MLRMSQADYAAIRKHGEETYPDECCGVLLGRVEGNDLRAVHAAVRCENVAATPSTNYAMDLRHIVRLQREARAQGLVIVGFYHSHPDHPPLPSPQDLQDAHWSGCSYVITAVEQGHSTVTKSFVLLGGDETSKTLAEEPIALE